MATFVQEIEILNIHKELSKIWTEEQGLKKTRATLFNLIVYLPSSERSQLFDSIVNNVVNKFPCRLLLVTCDDKSRDNKLNATVSAHTLGTGNLSIYCEIIRIEVSGKYKERVPFLIVPNLQADLPVYLLWTEDPLMQNPLFAKLAPIASRIIFDAESTANLQKYNQTVLEVEKQFKCEVGDLNWSSLAPWRKMLAEIYNDPVMLNHLQNSSEIKITYNKKESPLHPHTEIPAAYLQAWLASRLDWRLKSHLNYLNGKEKVKVSLFTTQVDLPSGAIVSLEIISKATGGHLRCKRDANSVQVHAQFSDNEKCELPVCHVLSGTKEGQEIINEIFYPSSKEHFSAALTMLSNTKWK